MLGEENKVFVLIVWKKIYENLRNEKNRTYSHEICKYKCVKNKFYSSRPT